MKKLELNYSVLRHIENGYAKFTNVVDHLWESIAKPINKMVYKMFGQWF